MEDFISKPSKGMDMDHILEEQPDGTYRFALNAVEGSLFGTNSIYSEPSNYSIASFNNETYTDYEYKIIGYANISEKQILLFVSKNEIAKHKFSSEIWILKNSLTTLLLTDENSKQKLGFSPSHPIQAVIRSRNNNEVYVYWIDNINKPRKLYLDQSASETKSYLDAYKQGNEILVDKINLFLKSSHIPKIQAEVIDTGGNLPSGKYIVFIQYVDDIDTNTNWIESTHELVVYHDSFKNDVTRIFGSTNIDCIAYNKGLTTKGILVTVNNLDPVYPYYRLGILCANTGRGKFDKLLKTNRIPNKQLQYTITGNEFIETGVQSIENFLDYIESAKTIAVLGNRLLLGNVKGTNKDYKKLQDFANEINAIGVVEEQQQNILKEGCNRHFGSTYYSAGYCPGETYSFGIVYIYKDGTKSPVFHIPFTAPQNKINTKDRYNKDVEIKLEPNLNNSFFNIKKAQGIHRCIHENKKCVALLRLDEAVNQVKHNYEYETSNGEKKELNLATFHRFPQREYNLVTIENNNIQYTSNDLKFVFDVDYCAAYIEFTISYKNLLTIFSEDEINKMTKSDQWLSESDTARLTDESVQNLFLKVDKSDQKKYAADKKFTAQISYYNIINNETTIEKLVFLERDEKKKYKIGFRNDEIGIFGYTKTKTTKTGSRFEAKFLRFYIDEIDANLYYTFKVLARRMFTTTLSKKIFPSSIKLNIIFTPLVGEEYVENGGQFVEKLNFHNVVKADIDYKYSQTGACGSNNTESQLNVKKVATNIYGIFFCNIKNPDSKNIVGYYIVRQERTDQHASVIDSACLLPVMNSGAVFKDQDSKKCAFGIIPFTCKQIGKDKSLRETVPLTNISEANRHTNNCSNFMNMTYSNRVVAAVVPTQLFREEKQLNFNRLHHFGNLNITAYFAHQCGYKDVQAGSSYVEGVHDKKEYDDTGFQLFLQTREIYSEFKLHSSKTSCDFTVNVKNINYVKALECIQLTGYRNECFNLSLDNRLCFIQPATFIEYKNNELPLVYLIRDNNNQYFDFLYAPYYQLEKRYFSESGSDTCYCNGGDVYISSMPFVTTSYVDTLLKYREHKEKEREGFFMKCLGIAVAVVGAIVGAIGAIFTAGSSLLLTVGAIGLAAGIIAGGALLVKSGIEIENMLEVFNKKWKLGLRDTIKDGLIWQYMQRNVKVSNNTYKYDDNGDIGYDIENSNNPSDDCIEYVGTVIRDMWFESRYNFNLRFNLKNSINEFLPDYRSLLLNYDRNELWYLEFDDTSKDAWYVNFNSLPVDECSLYVANKLVEPNDEKKSGKSLRVIPVAEWYSMNFDYLASNNAQQFFCLSKFYKGLDAEQLTKRIIYSNASNNEGVSDEFTQFQPNNYINLDGTTGDVTNLFTFNRQLFVHTERGLWYLPENVQERTTGEAGIVSFIGTGDFFSLPPRRVSEDEILAGGCQDIESVVKTDKGVFWVSRSDKKVYQFDGQHLIPISDLGMRNWFDLAFKNTFAYYIGVYDKQRKRVLFGNKDINNIRPFLLSFSIEDKQLHWVSFHSYCNNTLLRYRDSFLSYYEPTTKLFYHGKNEAFHGTSSCIFYDKRHPFILDVVFTSVRNVPQTWESLCYKSRLLYSDSVFNAPVETAEFDTFTHILFYNNRQISNLKNIKSKSQLNTKLTDYILSNCVQQDNVILINKDEDTWNINDIRSAYNRDFSEMRFMTKTIFNTEEFVTKFNKEKNSYLYFYPNESQELPWQESTMFRSNALVARFIYYPQKDTPNAQIEFIMATAKGQKSER